MKEVRGRSTADHLYFVNAKIPPQSTESVIDVGLEVEGACVILKRITDSGSYMLNFGKDSVFFVDSKGDADFDFNTLNYWWLLCKSTPLDSKANYIGDCTDVVIIEDTPNELPDWVQGELGFNFGFGDTFTMQLLDYLEIDEDDGLIYRQGITVEGKQIVWSWDLIVEYGDVTIFPPPVGAVSSETPVPIYLLGDDIYWAVSGTITATVDGYSYSEPFSYRVE